MTDLTDALIAEDGDTLAAIVVSECEEVDQEAVEAMLREECAVPIPEQPGSHASVQRQYEARE